MASSLFSIFPLYNLIVISIREFEQFYLSYYITVLSLSKFFYWQV